MRAWLRLAGSLAVAALAALLAYATIAAGFAAAPSAGQLGWAALAAVLAGGFAYLTATAGGYAWRSRPDAGAHPPTRADRRDRRIMLDRVRAKWITGVLRPALERTGGLEPPLVWRPGAVDPGARFRPIDPAPARVGGLFDRAGRALLVLGAPGAGKTVLLLRLAQRLAEEAEIDETQPLPAVFNLASWARREADLEEWLAERLVVDYQVPAATARAWIREERVLPLLDGLDEVPEDRRRACAAAIDRFREAHGFLPIAVTSRSVEYDASRARLRLLAAVEVEPLTRAQVEGHLAGLGRQADGVREALRHDPALWELAETPLLLDVLLGTDGQVPAAGGAGERRRQLFDGYVESMLRRRGGEDGDRRGVVARLGWLARQLIAHDQVVYYPEEMRPDWLASERRRRLVTVAPSVAAAALLVLAALAALALHRGLFVLVPLVVTAPFAVRWAYSPRMGALGQAWWSWDALARVAVLVAAAVAFMAMVAVPLGVRASVRPVNGAIHLDLGLLVQGTVYAAGFAAITFGALALDPLRRLHGLSGTVRRSLLTGLAAAVAVFLLEFGTPVPLALAVAAAAGLVAAGLRAGLLLLTPAASPDRHVAALLAGAVAGALGAVWWAATVGSSGPADAGHQTLLVAGRTLVEVAITAAAAGIVLSRAVRPGPFAGTAAFVVLSAAFAALWLSFFPVGLEPGFVTWTNLAVRIVVAGAAFVAVTSAPGSALVRRAARAWPHQWTWAAVAVVVAAALGLSDVAVDLGGGGYTPAAAIAEALLLAFLVLLARAAVAVPAAADPALLRRAATVAAASALLTLIYVTEPGGGVRAQLAFTALYALLAVTAARALLGRIDLPPVADDAAGPQSPGWAAFIAALLSGVAVTALYATEGLPVTVLGAEALVVLQLAVVTAALTFVVSAVMGCLGAIHLDRSRLARPGQAARLAARDAAATGLFAALAFAVVIGGGLTLVLALLSLGEGSRLVLPAFLLIGPTAALMAFAYWSLRAGGRSLLQLVTLRLLLLWEGALPWRPVDFLEEMTRLGLLRRAGSGHLFPHRLLMEHLAARAGAGRPE